MDKKRLLVIIIIIFIFIISICFSILYNRGKFSVSFETGTNDNILTEYVSKDDKVSKPASPIKDGYVFVEWQLDGEKFDFNTKIKKNIVLTAKWAKEEYITVKYVSNCDKSIKDEKILKGSSLDKLPDVKKEGYTFLGWYNNDKLYNHEEIYDDITLSAVFKEEKNIKIGSLVSIVGSYSNSIYRSFYEYDAALNWQRYVLDIYDGFEYPYMVGDETGVTGFFKEESLKVLK